MLLHCLIKKSEVLFSTIYAERAGTLNLSFEELILHQQANSRMSGIVNSKHYAENTRAFGCVTWDLFICFSTRLYCFSTSHQRSVQSFSLQHLDKEIRCSPSGGSFIWLFWLYPYIKDSKFRGVRSTITVEMIAV